MQRALLNCDRLDDLDTDKEYSITEICTLLNELPAEHVYFRGLPDMIEKSVSSISPTTLLSSKKFEWNPTSFIVLGSPKLYQHNKSFC